MNHTKPVNKQAAIFLSRKPRVESVAGAMDIFAGKLTDPAVVSSMAGLLDGNPYDASPCVLIELSVHKDMKSPGLYVVEMITRLKAELGREAFFGLNIPQP